MKPGPVMAFLTAAWYSLISCSLGPLCSRPCATTEEAHWMTSSALLTMPPGALATLFRIEMARAVLLSWMVVSGR